MLWSATEVMELYCCVSIEVDFCFGLQQERLCKTDLSGLKLSVSIANPCLISGDSYIGSKRSKSDYLNVFQTVCDLANSVYSLFNRKRFRWWDGCVGPHSLPLILTTSVKYGKLPAMYNCVKCVCICVIVSFGGLILVVSVGFKTLRMMFTQRGEYVAQMFCAGLVQPYCCRFRNWR